MRVNIKIEERKKRWRGGSVSKEPFFPADTGMSKFPIVTVKVCLVLSVVYKILYVYVYLRYTIFFPKYILEEMCLVTDNIFTNPGHFYTPVKPWWSG